MYNIFLAAQKPPHVIHIISQDRKIFNIVAIQGLTWPKTRARIEGIKGMFDRTRFFCKFT
jgi:hypothetical protein